MLEVRRTGVEGGVERGVGGGSPMAGAGAAPCHSECHSECHSLTQPALRVVQSREAEFAIITWECESPTQ